MKKIVLGLMCLVSFGFSSDVDGRYMCHFDKDTYMYTIFGSTWDTIDNNNGQLWLSELSDGITKGNSKLFVEKEKDKYLLKIKLFNQIKTPAVVSKKNDIMIILQDTKHKNEGEVICTKISDD